MAAETPAPTRLAQTPENILAVLEQDVRELGELVETLRAELSRFRRGDRADPPAWLRDSEPPL